MGWLDPFNFKQKRKDQEMSQIDQMRCHILVNREEISIKLTLQMNMINI
jgi:hypothetical protein